MKRKASLVVLVAMLIGIPLSHVELQSADDAWLLLVDGRPVDVRGLLSERYTRLTRDCRSVHSLPPEDTVHTQALTAIRQFSPPDSASAELLALSRQDDWLLAQVRFAGLQPAVLLLAATAQGIAVVEAGIWSGHTHPHQAGPFIRRYLRARVPQAPGDLLDCLSARF